MATTESEKAAGMTAAEAASQLITAEEFWRLPRKVIREEVIDGRVWSVEKGRELVNGVIVEMSPVGRAHGDGALEIGMLMRQHAKRNNLGFVGVEVGFQLTEAPDSLRAPDVCFIAASNVPWTKPGDGFVRGAPDIAVEVVSPADHGRGNLEEKIQMYLAAGTKLVWILHMRDKTVTVRNPNGRFEVLRGDDVLSGEEVFPGFAVRVRDLFDA